MPVSRDDVVWCYMHFLQRRPENEGFVHYFMENWHDWQSLTKTFSDSKEFRDRVGRAELLGALSKIDITLYNRTRHGFWFPVRLDDTSLLEAYALHDYEAAECDAIVRLVKPGDICIDLGARHGFMTCVMAHAAGNKGAVYSFEPGNGSEILEMARDINKFRNIKLIRQAAGDINGEFRFTTVAGRFDETASTSVQVVRLDDVLGNLDKPIRFMKIDIEGSEYRALAGAESILLRDRPIILIELFEELQQKVSGKSVSDLLALVTSWNYRVQRLTGEPFPDAEIERLVRDNIVFNVILTPETGQSLTASSTLD